MPGLREMRKRLGSIRTIGQLTGAMRSAAAAKFARSNAAFSAYREYGEACGKMLSRYGCTVSTPKETAGKPRDCIVLFGGNRGLCGGFNTELFGFFAKKYGEYAEAPIVLCCSKKASAFCRERGINTEREFMVSDIPAYEELRELSAYVRELYASGEAESVSFIYQSFVNMLTQTPVRRRLLPPEDPSGAQDEDGALYLPEREMVCARIAELCFDSAVYAAALENAVGAQAATLTAMRTAYDNATESAAKLELSINRRRQSEVTASVIETASDNISDNMQ